SVFISGHKSIIKPSSKDEILIKHLVQKLKEWSGEINELVVFEEMLKGCDAYIATGSNNSARYFEYYFSKYPHIIRKNRNSVAVLNGKETEAGLKKLGKDIFQYFGMGCRNVSKVFIPEDYKLDTLFEAIVDFGDVINHNKYFNNYSYYRSIYLLNSEKFLD